MDRTLGRLGYHWVFEVLRVPTRVEGRKAEGSRILIISSRLSSIMWLVGSVELDSLGVEEVGNIR